MNRGYEKNNPGEIGMKKSMTRCRKWLIAGMVVFVMAVVVLLVMEQVWIREERRARHEAAVWVRDEVRRVGVAAFVENAGGSSGHPEVLRVRLAEVVGLSPEMREALVECEVIGGGGTPQGILFNLAGGPTFYVPVDGKEVPGFFAGYQKERVLGDVYRIYRTHD